MRILVPLITCAAVTVVSFSSVVAQDECSGAIAVVTGANGPFDSTGMTTSSPPFSCVASGGSDMWFSYAATAAGDATVETCGAGFDTCIEAYSGTCAALTSLACNDDACGLQSRITFPVMTGTTYYIRVGGFAAATGSFPLLIDVTPPEVTLAQIQVAGLGALTGSFDVSGPAGNDLMLGVTHLDGRFYVSGGNNGPNPNTVFVFDESGNLLDSFPEISTTTFGYRDGATDGMSVMFGCEDGIYVHDPDGNLRTTVMAANGPQAVASPITGPGLAQLGIYRGLAYNPMGNGGNGSFWTATFASDLLECDLDGNVLTTLTNNIGWSIYGLAWDPYTQTLLANSVPNAGDIGQIDPVTGNLLRTIPRPINPGSAQGGLSPVMPAYDAGKGALSADGAWEVAGLDQASPDTVVRYRVHLWRNNFRNGYEEGRLLTAAGMLPLDPVPVKTMNAGNTISFTVEPLPVGPRPVFYLLNVGPDAVINGTTIMGRSHMIPELVALSDMSTPAGAYLSLMGRTGSTSTIPVPALNDLDYLRVQALTINPAGNGALAATNQMFFRYTSCAVLENFDALSQGTGNYPVGWSDGGGVRQWSVDAAGTPSGGTGPSSAVSLPNYMYCETSSPAVAGDTYVMNTDVYASSRLSMGTLTFELSRVGATIGTLEVRMDDGSGTFSTLLLSYTGPEPGGAEWTTEAITLPSPLPANIQFQFHYVRGTSFTGDIAIDDVCLK
ncbi:MAG: hypothetical protein IPM29_06785 [Planctomycetes bacterium]|nr:hypothetical protein [Planctomycetota bacterium]